MWSGPGQPFDAPHENIMIRINIFYHNISRLWDVICIPLMISLYIILSPFSVCPRLIGSYGIKLSEKASFASEFQSLTYKWVGADKMMLCADSKHGRFLETLSLSLVSFKSTLNFIWICRTILKNTVCLMSPLILINLIQFNFSIKMLLSQWTFGLLAFSFPAVNLTNSHCLSAFPSCSISIISPHASCVQKTLHHLPQKVQNSQKSQGAKLSRWLVGAPSKLDGHVMCAKMLFLNVCPWAQRS